MGKKRLVLGIEFVGEVEFLSEFGEASLLLVWFLFPGNCESRNAPFLAYLELEARFSDRGREYELDPFVSLCLLLS